jgi:tRNA-dihydrouridine synthase B
MRIGPFQLSSPVLVAPMAGVADRPYRDTCMTHGAALAAGEMVSARPALRGTRKSRQRLDHDGEPAPVAVQIVGADPDELADAARACVDGGAQIVDVNMGCPARKVCRVAAGSALLRDEALVGRILAAVVAAVDVPVTLKIRTGWDPSHRNGPKIARIAEDCGIAAVAVHGRTRACGFGGQAEHESARAIKAAVSIPVIANGDIDSPEKAAEVIAQSGVDGIMVGRGALGRPWLFRAIVHRLATGGQLPPPEATWVRDAVLGHLDRIHDHYGEAVGVRLSRKHLAWYARRLTGAEAFLARFHRAETARLQRQIAADWLDAAATKGEVLAA